MASLLRRRWMVLGGMAAMVRCVSRHLEKQVHTMSRNKAKEGANSQMLKPSPLLVSGGGEASKKALKWNPGLDPSLLPRTTGENFD